MNDPTKVERKINIVELASEIAQVELEATFKGKIYELETENSTKYTEEAQEVFNSLYDKYWNLIAKFSEVIE